MAQPDEDFFQPKFPKPEKMLGDMVASTPGSEADHAAMQGRADKLMSFIDQQKRDRDGGNILTLFMPNDERSPAKAVDEHGTRALLLDPDAVKRALTSDREMRKFMGVTGHEFTHFANKDPESERKAEFRADLGGAGPLGTKDPGGIIDYLKENFIPQAVGPYNASHADAKLDPEHLSKKDIKTVSDWVGQNAPTHPSPLERIAALELEAEMMKEGPRKGESAEQQSKRIVDAVMKRVDEGTLPEASIMKAPEGLSAQTLSKLSGMAPLPMRSVEEHHAAYTPAGKEAGGLKLG